MKLKQRSLMWGAVAALAACTPAPTPALPPDARLLVATAPQIALPAYAPCAGGLALFWVGEDVRGVHQDARLLLDGQLQPAITLPLPPTHPYDQTALALPGGNCLLFWLDADETRSSNRLFVALLDPALTVVRGPTALSDAATYAYAATVAGDGTPWAAWSAGSPAEPALSITTIDPAGRPRSVQHLIPAAGQPAWAQESATPRLCWLSEQDGSLWQLNAGGDIGGDSSRDQGEDAGISASGVRLSSGVFLAPGDQVEAVRAAQAQFEWHIRRADGSRETWQTAEGEDGQWRAPSRQESALADDWPQARITDANGVSYRLSADSYGDRARLWLEPLGAGN